MIPSHLISRGLPGCLGGLSLILSLAVLSLNGCRSEPVAATNEPEVPESEIGMAVHVGDAIVRNYRPNSTLNVPVTEVRSAAFPAIDAHCHWTIRQDPQALLDAMDERNVLRAINLSGGWGERLDAMLDIFHRTSPDRLLIFCNIDWSRIDEPDFGQAMSEFLRDAHRRGVSGLKIFKDLGLRVRDASGEAVHIDDPRLDPIWHTCGQLRMPVLIHSADPAPFFQPLDENNERWMQLQRRPSWSFHGDEFPSRDVVMAQRNRVLARHPNTTFIGAHMGSHAGDLVELARVLDAYPNFYVDISGRVGELGRQPYSTRRFMIKYQDRVLFGTDRYPGRTMQPRYRIYFRFLETEDEYFDYYDHPFPPAGEWKIYGVGLPADVLRKVYFENAEQLLSGT